MFNIMIAPGIYTCDQAALHGAYVLIEGVLLKDHGAIPHCAGRTPPATGEWVARLALTRSPRRVAEGK